MKVHLICEDAMEIRAIKADDAKVLIGKIARQMLKFPDDETFLFEVINEEDPGMEGKVFEDFEELKAYIRKSII